VPSEDRIGWLQTMHFATSAARTNVRRSQAAWMSSPVAGRSPGIRGLEQTAQREASVMRQQQ
jgi:hypothetical protein